MNYTIIYFIIISFFILIITFIYLNKNKITELFQSSNQFEKPKYILSKNTIFNLLNQN
jgi:hypothetical protein